MRSWKNSPRYQRSLQKIAALRPEHRAILNTVSLDPQFADEKMRRTIRSLITKTGNVNRNRNLALNQDIAGGRNAMRRRSMSYERGQGGKALALGMANLGLSAAGAYGKRKKDAEISDALKALTRKYTGAGLPPNSQDYGLRASPRY